MAEADKVSVRITASQSVHYDQIVTFSRDDWVKFKKLYAQDAARELGCRLDMGKVHRSDGINVFGFDAFVVDMNGKPVEPADEYIG